MSHLKYRADIDGLRGIAVLLVVGFHGEIALLRSGFIGVDVFFVISGYLISGIILMALESGTFTFRDFYVRRINRIFPALAVLLAAVAAIGWTILFPEELHQLGRHIIGGASFTSNFVLWGEAGYFDSSDKPLLHLWSLAVEEQFYLVWPLVLWVGYRRRWNLTLLVAGIVAGSFAFNIYVSGTNATAAFYSPLTRFWEIMAGSLVSIFERRRVVAAGVREGGAAAGVAMLALSAIVIRPEMAWPGWMALLPVAGTVMLLASGSNTLVARHLLSRRLLVGVGLISYPLYLWHWPLLVFARQLNQEQLSRQGRLGVILLSILLAYLTYRLVERPIRFGARKQRSAARLVPVLGALGIAGVVLHSGAVGPRLGDAYAASVEAAQQDRAPGGYFTKSGDDIQPFVLPGDSTRSVVFLGDSHMSQYWPRFQKLAAERRGRIPQVVFLTYGACPVLPRVNKFLGSSWDGAAWRCDRFYDLAMRRSSNPHVKSVVIGSYWEAYLEQGALYGIDDPARRPLLVDNAETDSAFARLERDVARLVGAGKRVYLVLSNPVAEAFHPATMLPERIPGLADKQWRRSVSFKAPSAAFSRTMERLRAIASRTGAEVIDPIPYLCPNLECPTVTERGTPIYVDAHHMRASYTRDRVTYLDKALDTSQSH